MGLDTVDLVVTIEKTFHISIPNPEAAQISTIGDIHECVWKHLSAKPAYLQREKSITREEIEQAINQLIANFAGFEVHEISPEKSITSDLGLD
jgi:acyl carrier protein